MNQKVTLFYDGACPLCSREIAHYRHNAPPSMSFVDIACNDFDADAYGLDLNAVHRVMHVQVDGETRTGVDAFIAVWQAIPRYGWLARLARLRFIHACLKVGYFCFAKVRPLLQRRGRALDCSSGMCRMD